MNLGQAMLADQLSARDRAIVALRSSGLSPSEISELQVGDIRIFPSMCLVRVRGGRCARCWRYVRLDGAARSALSYWLGYTGALDARSPLFTSESGGRPLSERGVQWVLARLRKESA